MNCLGIIEADARLMLTKGTSLRVEKRTTVELRNHTPTTGPASAGRDRAYCPRNITQLTERDLEVYSGEIYSIKEDITYID